MVSNFDNFQKQPYLNLETFRKNGVGVKTPVWFILDQGRLFVRTEDGSGKVKRVRRTTIVRVAPCKAQGDLLGEWVESQARIVDEQESKRVDTLLNRKYGVPKMIFDALGILNRRKYAVIEIQPAV